MRTTTVASVVLVSAGLLALTGCSSSTPTATSPATTAADTSTATSSATTATPATTTTTPAATSTRAGGGSGGGTGGGSGNGAAACTAADLSASLGSAPAPAGGGQLVLPLRYTNTGSSPCSVTGYPGATLQGPDYPQYGPQYQLPRSTITSPSTVTIPPGEAAVADLTLLTTPAGASDGWQATELLTIAPGDTTVMTVPFPADTPVGRQDAATRPGTFVGTFTGPVR